MAIKIEGLKPYGEIILHWVVPANYMGIDFNKNHTYWPSEYAVTLMDETNRHYGGVMLWGKYNGVWQMNPSPRLLVLFLLNELLAEKQFHTSTLWEGILPHESQQQMQSLIEWVEQIYINKDGA